MTIPKQTYKALLLDYDALLLASDDECCFSLSEREVQILLAFVDYALWPTRYFATDNAIDRELIAKWGGNLARKLMSGCCPDDGTLHRFNEDGVYESSIDGGITWEPDPDADPRQKYVLAPPLPGAASAAKRCAAADNIRGTFKQYRDDLAELLSAGSTVIAIIAGILAFIAAIAGVSGVATGISVLLLSLAAEILTLTPTSVVAQISETVLDEFKCLVYCRLDDNGQMSEADWNSLKADLASHFTGFPETFFWNTVNALGYIGMSNAGTMGPATAEDCDCDCGCGDGCTFDWSATLYTTKDPVSGSWTFSGADCDSSAQYRCILDSDHAELSGIGGVCVDAFRYSVARVGGSSIDILINGTEAYNDPMTGMATDGTPQVDRVFNLPAPMVVNTIRFTCNGGTQIYIRDLRFSVCTL